MTDTTDNAWNTFWERDQKRSANGSGCMPAGWQGIADMQRRVWQSFARNLPKGAHVLDIATGDGAVLSHIAENRRDLTLTGVDRATALPVAPAGITLRGGVSMENLPFEGDGFAAATSQFGFEYGDIRKTAAEIARVMQPGGKLGLLTHRANGPIVAHNRKRREQITWAIDEQKLPQIAKDYLKLRSSGAVFIPQNVVEAPAHGATLHGNGSAAWEIAEAIRQTLHLGQKDDPARVTAVIQDIEAQARNELGRIASLEAAAAVASDADNVIAVLENAGLKFVSEAMLTDGRSADPFADFRTYTLA